MDLLKVTCRYHLSLLKKDVSLTMQKKTTHPFQAHILPYLLLIVSVLFIYFPSFNNDYGFNDNYIFNEITEKGLSATGEIFTSPYRYIKSENLGYGYRPITSLSVATEISIFGKNPSVSHGINILLYILVVCFLYHLVTRFFPSIKARYWLLAILFFVALSIHTDVVCNIKSRDELLCCFFILCCLWASYRYLNKQQFFYILLVFFFSILAAWSKPTNIFYILILTPILFFYQRKSIVQNMLLIGSFIIGGIAARVISFQLVELGRSPRPFIQFPFESSTILERIPTAIYSIGKYLELVFFPFQLSFYYGYNQVPITWSDSMSSPFFYIGLLAAFLFPILAFFLYKKNKMMSLGLVILWLGCLFLSNLLKPGPGLIAERFFLAPSIGVIFLLGGLFKELEQFYNLKKQSLVWGLSFLIGGNFLYQAIKSYQRNFDWKDNITLFQSDIGHLQNSAKANLLLADEMMYENRQTNTQKYSFNKVASHYKRSIEVYPDYDVAWINYAFACLYFKQPQQAKGPLDKALAIERSTANLTNLATYFQQMQQPQKEKAAWIEIIDKNENDAPTLYAYTQLHNLLLKQQDYTLAQQYAQRSIKIFPNESSVYDHMAKCCYALEQYEEGMKNWKKAYQVNPQSKVMLYKLYKAYESLQQLDSAQYYQKLHNQHRK